MAYDDDGRMSGEEERREMEHARAIQEEEFYWEVEQRRFHLEQPALEFETPFESRNADGVKK